MNFQDHWPLPTFFKPTQPFHKKPSQFNEEDTDQDEDAAGAFD